MTLWQRMDEEKVINEFKVKLPELAEGSSYQVKLEAKLKG